MSLALTLISTGPVQAAIVFDNFGASNGYNTSSNRSTTLLGDPPADHDIAQAFSFTGEDVRLNTIQLALRLAGGSNEVDVFLMADNWDGNKAMGTNSHLLFAPDSANVIESFRLNGAMTSDFNGGIVTITSSLHSMLSADTYYWLVISTPAMNGIVSWYGAAEELAPKPALIGERYSDKLDPLWEISLSPGGPGFAFRIEGSIVPEPTTFVIWSGIGLVGLVSGRRRRSTR